MNTYYNFRIVDNSQTIILYLGDLSKPLLTLSTTNREGGTTNLIDIENSRGTLGGGVGGEDVGVWLNNLEVREYVNLNIYTAIELGFLAQTNEVYQIQTSADMKAWTNFDAPILGVGSNWFKTYSILGKQKQFYRVEVTQ